MAPGRRVTELHVRRTRPFRLPSVALFALALAILAATVRLTAPASAALDDAAPAPLSPAQIERAAAQPDLGAEGVYAIREEEYPNGKRYYAVNVLGGPIQVQSAFRDVENMTSDPVLPTRFVVPALGERLLVTVWQTDLYQPARYALNWDATPGDPRARHNDSARYRVPFSEGATWRMDQGFDGRFSHTSPEARYALDLAVPVGTWVLAARAGVVMQVEDHYIGGATDDRLLSKANAIRVLHDDGSMGVYAHLDTNSALVKIGERVAVGAPLARSGNTGFSSGPHLHFSVQVNAGMRLASVPFDMDGVDERGAER
jgi:murein DD-endopeptidase MepM/ murein hydrolase activator NlpD